MINFIKMTRVSGDTGYTQNIKPTSDPDGDGISNLEEYARNLDPTKKNSTPLAVVTLGNNSPGTQLDLSATKDRRARDINYLLEKSEDLKPWEADTQATPSISSRAGAIETLNFRATGTGVTRFSESGWCSRRALEPDQPDLILRRSCGNQFRMTSYRRRSSASSPLSCAFAFRLAVKDVCNDPVKPDRRDGSTAHELPAPCLRDDVF